MGKDRRWIEVDSDGRGWQVDDHKSTKGNYCVYDYDHRTVTQLPVVVANFCCRMCGHTDFAPVYTRLDAAADPLSRSTSFQSRLIKNVIRDYYCPSCTVHFDDPTKFSANQPPEIVPPVATPEPSLFESSEEPKAQIIHILGVQDSGIFSDCTS